MPPERIQFSRRRGSRIPEGAVYVGRHPSPRYGRWGNPFIVGKTIGCDTVEDAVAMYKAWLHFGATAPYPRPGESEALADLRERVLADLHRLAGRDLACWCPLPAPGEPDMCHGAVLLQAANSESVHA